MGGGACVKEGNKGTVLVRKQTDRLDLATANMTKYLFGSCVGRDVAQINRSAGSIDRGAVHGTRRAWLHRWLHVEATSRRLGREELRGTILRRRNHGVVLLRGHVLLGRAGHAAVVLLGGLRLLMRTLESGKGLELRATKGSRAARLERAAHEELRGEKRRKLHIESISWGSDIGSGGTRPLVHLGVERGDVATARMSLGKARDVGSEGTMGKASIAVGGLGDVAGKASRVAAVLGGTVQILHTEKMRGDV